MMISSTGKIKLAGFTLIELLCVVAIISVLIALSTPRIATTAKVFYFKNKVKQLEASYKFIREKSVREERRYKIQFDFDARRITAFFEKSPDEFEILADSLTGKIKLGNELTIAPKSDEFSGQEIIFFPDGGISFSSITISSGGQTAHLRTSTSGEILLEFMK